MAAPQAKAVMRADNRRLRGDLQKSQGMFARTFRGIGGGIKRTLAGALSPLGVGIGVTGLAIAGKQVLDFEDKLNRLQIQSDVSNDRINLFRQQVDELSKSTGIAREQLLGGTEALVNLQGPTGFSIEQLQVLADANLATGATMEDLAGLAFSLNNAFRITTPEDLTKGLSGIIQAGKEGAIPLTEMSLILQQLSAQFKDVGGTGPAAAADLAAALQVVRRGFGTASEAGTGLGGLLTALAKNAERFEKAGVKIFERDPKTGAKVFRDFRSIIDDIGRSKLARDPTLLVKAFGRDEARKAFMAIMENREAFEDLAQSARDSDAVQTDSEKRRESAAFRIQQSMNNVKLAIAKAFTPERIEKVARALELMARGIEILVDNLPTIAGILAGFKLSPALNNLIGAGGLGGLLGGPGGIAGGGGPRGRGGGGGAFGGLGLGPAFIVNEVGDTFQNTVERVSRFQGAFLERALGVLPTQFGGAAPRAAGPEAGARMAAFGMPRQEVAVDVNVSVDQRGMLRAEETEESKTRRSTQ